jgi:small-conductance mechanosensitive channel
MSSDHDSIMTPSKFSVIIENYVIHDELSYIDAVLKFCEEYDTDPEDIKKFMSQAIKEKLEVNFQELGYIKRGITLTEFLG